MASFLPSHSRRIVCARQNKVPLFETNQLEIDARIVGKWFVICDADGTDGAY